MSMDGTDIIRALRCMDGGLCCSARGNCKYKYPAPGGFHDCCADWNIKADAADYIETLLKEIGELRRKAFPEEVRPLALVFGESREEMNAEMKYLLTVLRCEPGNTTAADRVAVLAKGLAKGE